MSIGKTDTKVYFYQNDYNRVCAEIYHHQHNETGGNLFGLWTEEGRNVVVHAALGPGKKCKRTDVSFYQDIEYMSRVGTFLNTNFMLCHIGEWHSHHHLSLNEPSSGDKRTIRQNYPEGVKMFLVIIGNIIGNDQVILFPYFFSENGKTCKKGKFEVLVTDSPFTTDPTIANEMNKGAENSSPLIYSSTFDKDRQETAPEGSSYANGRSLQSTTNTSSNSGSQSPETVLQNIVQPQPPSDSCAEALKSGSGTLTNKNPSTDSPIIFSPQDYDRSRSSQTTPRSSSEQARTATSQISGYASASNNHSTISSLSANQVEYDDKKQTRREINIKRLLDEIQSNFPGAEPVLESTGSLDSSDTEMKFKHESKYWLIRFPPNFPENPATMSQSFSKTASDSSTRQTVNVGSPNSLNNYISILLAVKKKCSNHCSCCEKINAQSLARSDAPLNLLLTQEGEAKFKELWAETESNLADQGSLKKGIKYIPNSQSQEPTLEMSFTHCLKNWTVGLSSTFPSTPAEVTYQEQPQNPARRALDASNSSIELDSPGNILLAISKKCYCKGCKRLVLKNNK